MASEESTIEFVVAVRGGTAAAADIDKVKAAVASAGGEVKAMGGNTVVADRANRGFTSGIKGMLVQLGLVTLAYKGLSAAKNAIVWTRGLVEQTEKLTKSTGLSVEKASQYLTVTEALGVPTTALSTAFGKLSKDAVKQAEAHGKTITAFDRLGISQRFVNEHTHDFNSILDKTLERLHAMPGGIHKNALELELFGRGAQSLGPLLNLGADGVERLLKTANKYGAEIKGKGVAEELDHLREAQIESSLATDGLRIAFTKLAGPSIVQGLKMFARLKNDVRTGNWVAFDKEIEKGADLWTRVLDDIAVKSVEQFGRLAPRMLKAFWHGFTTAPLGDKAIIAGLLVSRLGLKDALFDKIGHAMLNAFLSPWRKARGKRAAENLAEGALGSEGAFGKAGTKLGGVFGAALRVAGVLAVAALVAYAADKLGHALRGAEKAEDVTPSGQHLSKSDVQTKEAREKAHMEAIAKGQAWIPDAYERSEGVGIEHSKAYKRHHWQVKGGAFGARALSPGLLEVGERGPEIVHMPQGATVAPIPAGSLVPSGDTVIKIDGRVLARVSRRQRILSEAAGA